MTSINSISNRIRELNDAFRRGGLTSGRWVTTPGVAALGTVFLLCAVSMVRQFDAFTPDNDPHGEHDFGTFDLAGERLFWKIDFYDPSLKYSSESPEDLKATVRVLTIMLASEY